jgi:hypothetical protein
VSAEDESTTMAAFIRGRQDAVLQRAIDSLSSCPDDDLGTETHRIAGTLGTYQLSQAHDAVRALEAAVADSAITVDARNKARADTLAALERIATSLRDRDDDERRT